MRRSALVLLVLALPLAAVAQPRKTLTLEDIFASSTFAGRSIDGLRWNAAGSALLYLRQGPGDTIDIWRQDAATGRAERLAEGAALHQRDGDVVHVTQFQASSDERVFLLAGPLARVWRRPVEGQHYLFDRSTGQLRPLSGIAGGQRYAKLSPDAAKVGFVRANNLFVVDRTGVETQLTTDGTPDLINGQFDWVYEEEFGVADGWRWSPDGKRIAFWQLDQSAVRAYPLLDYLTPYPKVTWFKYPKAGERNSLVRIGVIDLDSRKTTWMDLGPETDIYIPSIQWTRRGDLLAIQRLNRLQNKLELLFGDVTTGSTRVVLTETDPCWVRVSDDLTFLRRSDRFVWTSQRTGYLHAYLYDYSGRLVAPLTQGDWEITSGRATESIAGVDEEGGWLYFTGKRDGPIEQQVYRVRFDGAGLQRVSSKAGWHAPMVSPDGRHFVDTFSDVATPPQISLHRTDGTFVRWLEENPMPQLRVYELAAPEFVTVKASDGQTLNAYVIKPTRFDPKRKYPVIVYAYGGVSSQTVVNRWGGTRGLWHQYMAQRGYIIFSLDNRGTGGRGKVFENYMYQNLGTWPLRDQIEGVKYLATFPYVDPSRIGMYGSSGGGYLTSLALTAGADYFHAGVAMASVIDYRYYDSIWSERYMGLPQQNKEAYDRESVLGYADRLKGHLLLVHGMADDNVHMQNTVLLQEALQAANRQFEVMYYHGRTHSLSGGNTQYHLFTMITDYFDRYLRAGLTPRP